MDTFIKSAPLSSEKQVRLLRHEYNILHPVDIPGVVKAIELKEDATKVQLVFRDIKGKDVQSVCGENITFKKKIEIFTKAAALLGRVHSAGIIHKDISPQNLLVDPSGDVHLINFGIASRFTLRQPHLGNPERLEGNLGFISPEQTGRMNRSVDYRSDLYSLGATFFNVFSGQLPFNEPDALSLVYAHLATPPARLADLSSEIPAPISDIVHKLMAKDPEDRYQSATGLSHDLEKCDQLLGQSGEIASFSLGKDDFSGRLKIPEKLYGRERERTKVLKAFDNILKGSVELTLVSGYSGTGKSALINETHRPLTATKGHFIEGKFDQFQRNIPFYAWIQAFTNFVDLLLTEEEETLKEWKSIICDAVGDNGAVLTEVIPNLEAIIGPQLPVPELTGHEAQMRFNQIVHNFIYAITTEDHPLILFIDDLQWADLASLNLLKSITTDPDNGYLLCVGAYRDNEVTPGHALIPTIKDIRQSETILNEIVIGNLSHDAISELLSESLNHPNDEQLDELTALIIDKTQGNAFFTHQFIHHLYEEGMLSFNPDQKAWCWSCDEVLQANITDNVVEFMAKKVGKLNPETQHVIKLASCIGNKFDLDTLTIISRQSDCLNLLQEAIAEGLVQPLDDKVYKFGHDRIQQAAYSRIPDADKSTTHLKIGKTLYHSFTETEREDRIFELVNHLTIGLDSDTDDIRDITCRACLLASKKARLSAAYDSALEYISIAHRLLGPQGWKNDYKLTLATVEELITLKFATGNFKEADRFADELIAHARTTDDKSRTYFNKLNIYLSMKEMGKAVEFAESFFPEFGIEFPASDRVELKKVLERTRSSIDRSLQDSHALESTFNLGENTNRQEVDVIKIMILLWTNGYFLADYEIMGFATLITIDLALEHGETEDSAFGWVCYAIILAMDGHIEDAIKIGNYSLKSSERYGGEDTVGRVTNFIGHFLGFYSMHYRNNIPLYQRGHEANKKTGDMHYAAWSLSGILWTKLLISTDLQEILDENDECLAFTRKTGEVFNENVAILRQQVIKSLQGSTKELGLLDDGEFNTGKWLNEMEGMKIFVLHNWYHCMMAQLSFFKGEYTQSYEHCRKAHETTAYNSAIFWGEEYPFYEALSMSQFNGDELDLKVVERVADHYRRLSENGSENFLHKHQLIQAELQRHAKADFQTVLDLYDNSITTARTNGFRQDAAMANELCAQYLMGQGRDKFADPYIREAHQLFSDWGAYAVTKRMENQYPEILGKHGLDPHGGRENPNADNAIVDERHIDLATIIQANATLSQQVRLDDLIEIFLELLTKNSGANKIALLRRENDTWMVLADQENNTNLIQASCPLEKYDNLPQRLIAYVIRSKRYVLTDNINDHEHFQDPYFSEHASKSILVVPAVHQGQINAVLFLSNDLSAGTFTVDRYQLIQSLLTQLAISIENCVIYENLEHIVHERTRELEEAHQRLVTVANRAGRAEVASGVIHNVGNALNSVMISLHDVSDRLKHSKFHVLQKVIALLCKQEDPINWLRNDPQGQQAIPLMKESIDIIEEDVDMEAQDIEQIRVATEHIRHILHRQQCYVTGMRLIEEVNVSELMEEALSLVNSEISTFGIDVIREYDQTLIWPSERHRLMQILVNLISNAVDALKESEKRQLKLTVCREGDYSILRVQDTGLGFDPKTSEKLFEFGFTTKNEGHGIGLHASAVEAQSLGGELTCFSDGSGQGATFTLRIPKSK